MSKDLTADICFRGPMTEGRRCARAPSARPAIARGSFSLRKWEAAGRPGCAEAVTEKIQIQFFHLNQISGSSAEITISAKAH